MHGRALSWQLYQGFLVQTRLSEKAYEDVGEEHMHGQKNHSKISQGKLCRIGTRDPTGADISTMRHKEYGIRICGSGEDDLGNLFSSPLLKSRCRLTRHH